MSFETLAENTAENKELLKKVAEEFGVEVRSNAKAETIIEALEEDGVTWELAADQVAEIAAKNAELAAAANERRLTGPKQLLKMERENRSYEVRGVKFTREHPFALVPEEDAEYIVEEEDGFRYATPKEAKEYYG